jgi:hypothetical protein
VSPRGVDKLLLVANFVLPQNQQQQEEEGRVVMEPEEEAKFITLQDGRRLAYREQGVTPPEVAQRTLLVLHGIASSRLAGMPGNQSEHTKLHESNNNPSTYRNEFLSSFSSLLQFHDDANDYRFHLSCDSSSV